MKKPTKNEKPKTKKKADGKAEGVLVPKTGESVPAPIAASAVSVNKKGKPAKTEVKQLICLLGDEQLVKEYSAAFQEKGIAVQELKNLSSLKTSAKRFTAAIELTLESTVQKRKNLETLDSALPENVPIISNAITETILSQSHALKHRHRFVGIAAIPTLLANSLVELSPSVYTTKEIADTVKVIIESAKKETAMVQDSVGMVMPRILCQIINEALFTVQNDVATPKDIDEAMKHGTNYPQGPIAWGEQIGFSNVVAVLDALYHHYHEERYKAAPILRQLALAGIFWETKE